MLALTGPEEFEDPAFKWDKKRGVGGKNKDVRFYESFSYDGVDYALYDCVYMHKQGEPAPYIGKLVKIWETAGGIKKVKVHWFFRPSEISYYLKDAKVSEKELFFASGDGKGLANINPLEAIAGKCNVICTSADSRNPQPSARELQMADYVFYRIFDVKSCTISDQIDDKVGGLEGNFVFNRREGVVILGGPKLDDGENYEGNVVAFNGTPEIAGNLDGKQFSGVDVISIKNSEIAGTALVEGSTTGDKNLGLQKNLKSNKNSNVLQGQLSKPNVGGNLSSCGEKTSRTIVVSRDVTQRPSTTKVSPKETPKLIPNNDVDVSEQVAKPAQSLSTSKKRPLEMTIEESKEKPNLVHDKSRENMEKNLGSNSCPNDEGNRKKAKLDNSAKRQDENKNCNSNKVKEKMYVGPKNSPKVATCDNNGKLGANEGPSMDHSEKEKNHVGKMKNMSKSLTCDDKMKLKLCEGTSKEYDDKKDDKKNLPKSLTCNDKTKSKLCEGPSKEYDNEKDDNKNLPKSLTCNDKAKLKLCDGTSNEYDNEKDRKLSNDNLPKWIATKSKDGREVGGKIIEVTRRPPEKATWIKLSWEHQMEIAHDQGRLVLLLNLDPQYTSGEVEDIIWHTFRESCTARVLPHTAISNPSSGQAFVVFKTRDAANKVVHKLDEECLMLPNQRPLVACHGVVPRLFEKQTTYVGHLDIDKDRRQMLRGMKEAVSTSHYSQHNTIEYEMAMDWCLLQSQSDKWWKSLYEQQRKELKKHTDDFKSK